MQAEVIACRRCPRLVRYRQEVAEKRPLRYRDWNYWAKPLPGFGDEKGRLLILGLAPAAQGGNRTGRMFTGDGSGDWLMGTLHRFGFANQPRSEHPGDGLALRDAYITATIRCAPPHNKPLPMEIASCRPFLVRELRLLPSIRVMIALGRIAFEGALHALAEAFQLLVSPRPAFAHNQSYSFSNGLTLIASYHPSRQNTQTGRLTQAMFDAVFARVQEILRARDGA
ncbi:MAG: uracil-DNA glycosylase [candidate division NC10 bacterium]|nr:uracil-DNA glycosylase [candidate division NC10 bacterium]